MCVRACIPGELWPEAFFNQTLPDTLDFSEEVGCIRIEEQVDTGARVGP